MGSLVARPPFLWASPLIFPDMFVIGLEIWLVMLVALNNCLSKIAFIRFQRFSYPRTARLTMSVLVLLPIGYVGWHEFLIW